jgi:hypothetical protein
VLDWLKVALFGWYIRWAARPNGPRDCKARLDPNAKCPACGHRQGKIRWTPYATWLDGAKGAVVHRCDVDGAFWFEKPLVSAEKWAVELPEPEPEQKTAEG